MITLKKGVPRVHYYNQDFVDIYVRTWNIIDDWWLKGTSANGLQPAFFSPPEADRINQMEACFSPFYLVYSNRLYQAQAALDNFYAKQETNGAIRGEYSLAAGEPLLSDDNPLGILPPLFAWTEFDLYHKIGLKKRVKDVLPILKNYFSWLDEAAFDEEAGLYSVPAAAGGMPGSPRPDMHYPVDFNCQQALNALYMSALGDILNDKEISFRYKQRYFMLKTKINSLMWDVKSGFYYDLNAKLERLSVKTIGAFWALLAELPNKESSEALISHLKNPQTFGSANPFPTVALNEGGFCEDGQGYNGGVYPWLTFMVIKGLEKFNKHELAREAAIRHLYYILDAFHPEGDIPGSFWESYLATRDGAAFVPAEENGENANKKGYIGMAALATITLMIENIVGLYISLPRKTVDWIVPTLELMGIENLSLKRNVISILSAKNSRNSWEIRLESEKLYYFTINLLNIKKKTLPIPSGRCSMLLDKL